ncbi:ABC transporter permease, partial [Eggerthella lenta]|nr:ABC transporter permease [Eggerthella lenta]
MSVDEMETDEAFWHVFSFEFLCGKPYTKADFDSGLSKAVVSASVARRLFGTTDVAGCTIQLNKADYTITGVVKDVSNLATAS